MGTQVGSSYVVIVHLPFPHLPHAPFSLQLWEKHIKVCLLPLSQHCLLAWQLWLSIATRTNCKTPAISLGDAETSSSTKIKGRNLKRYKQRSVSAQPRVLE